MDSSTVFLSHPSHAVFNSLPATAVSFQSSCPSLWIEADSVTMATLPPSPGRPGPTHTNTVSSVGGRATTDCVCVCVFAYFFFRSKQHFPGFIASFVLSVELEGSDECLGLKGWVTPGICRECGLIYKPGDNHFQCSLHNCQEISWNAPHHRWKHPARKYCLWSKAWPLPLLLHQFLQTISNTSISHTVALCTCCTHTHTQNMESIKTVLTNNSNI